MNVKVRFGCAAREVGVWLSLPLEGLWRALGLFPTAWAFPAAVWSIVGVQKHVPLHRVGQCRGTLERRL